MFINEHATTKYGLCKIQNLTLPLLAFSTRTGHKKLSSELKKFQKLPCVSPLVPKAVLPLSQALEQRALFSNLLIEA